MFTEEQAMVLVDKAVTAAFTMFSEKKYIEASIVLNQVLRINPDNAKAFQLLGLISHNIGKHQDGVEYFNKALEHQPDNAESHNNISLCYSNLGKYQDALPHILRAVELAPQCHYMHSNLGLLYRTMRQKDKAIEHFKLALAIKEDDANVWCMLGGCYGEDMELDEAEKCFLRAVEIDPKFAPGHVDLASIYHMRHDPRAWGEYEWRFEHFDQTKFWLKLFDLSKRWYGEELDGKRIMVHSEQGLGDCIHFLRYIRLLKERGAHVILHCQPALESLVAPLVDEVYTTDPATIPLFEFRPPDFPMPEYDYFASVVSLPYLLGIPPIPKTPYLFTNRRINTDNYSDYFKIGIVWAGNPQHPNDAFRSCKLTQFLPIHDTPGVKLFSLQADKRMRQYRFSEKPVDLMEGSEDMRLVDMADHMQTLEDTAAVLQSMDLVITVDTAVLHLAGAMGVETWGLIPYNTDWRWGVKEETTEWYSSVRLFRQLTLGDWNTPFQKVKEKLHDRLSKR